jgi:two-component system, chemotaxis family, protein-glutamate methylesterase/glutaminase
MEPSIEKGTHLFPPFEAVVLAASYGGIEAIKQILSIIPANFPVPIVFLLHVGDEFSPLLPRSIGRRANLPVKWAEESERMASGQIYIAPPGAHLLIDETRRFVFSRTPRVQYARPSATMLFCSMASVFKEHLLAVILTGYGSDGALGVSMVRAMGGQVIAQDKRSSLAFDMPEAAIHSGGADLILPLNKIAYALIALTMVPGASNLLSGFQRPPFTYFRNP